MTRDVLEVVLGEGRLRLGPGRLVRDEPVGEIDEASATERLQRSLDWGREIGEPARLFIDLTGCGKLTRGARQILWKGLMSKQFGRIAFLAPHPMARMIAKFTIGTLRRKDMRVFSDAEEALAWVDADGDLHD